MRDEKMIDPAAYDAASREPVVLDDGLRRGEAFGQYFKEEVRRFLVQRFGWDRVYQGGLKVYTTVNLDMQKAAENAVALSLAAIEKRQGARKTSGEDSLQAALVAMDPHTGDVRAMVGGRDFAESSFNRATQAKRQPGSAFKPFVYAAALERGFSPATLIEKLDEPIMTLQGAWVPEDEHLESPTMTMRTALRTSSNRAAVRMLDDVGIPVTVEYAKLMGVGSVPSVPSLALGSGEVTVLSMTSAFSTFANEGVVPTPVLVRRVETSDGQVLYRDEHTSQRAISEATAFQMAEMLADVINSGTAWPARREGFMLPAAGKTGTTNDYHDAWFIGFTPQLATGVWVGYDQPRTIIGRGYAAELAVPMWAHFMKEATRSDKAEWFSRPSNVTTARICRLSGRLATDACRDEEPSAAASGARRPTTRTSSPAPSRPTRARCTIPSSRGRSARWRRSSCRSPLRPHTAPGRSGAAGGQRGRASAESRGAARTEEARVLVAGVWCRQGGQEGGPQGRAKTH